MQSRKDFEIKTPGGHTLGINVCQSVITELYGLKDDLKSDQVGAFVQKDHGHFSIGWGYNISPRHFLHRI